MDKFENYTIIKCHLNHENNIDLVLQMIKFAEKKQQHLMPKLKFLFFSFFRVQN